MKRVVFLGDSITEGKPGVSYVDRIDHMDLFDFVNYGKGGDTIRSINKRLKKLYLDNSDYIFFFVGVNEVYSQINLQNKLIKVLMNQTPEKDLVAFESRYIDAVDYLLTKTPNLVLITPLLVGEDIDSTWNKMLKEYVDVVKNIALSKNLVCIDSHRIFTDYLKDKDSSSYLPYKLMNTRNDTLVKSDDELDLLSSERGLKLTIDGVHLNSTGASLIVREIEKLLKKQ